jgi:hypothetical protein
MSSSRLRSSALAGIAGGLAIIAWVGLGQVHENFIILAVVALPLLVAALPGLHRSQHGRDGRLGRAGYVVALAGAVLVTALVAVYVVGRFVFGRGQAIDDSAALGVLLAVGFFGMLLGFVPFGIATLKAGALPRWGALLLMAGLPIGVAIDTVIGAFFAGADFAGTEWGFFIGVPLFALGLIVVSHAVLIGAQQHHPATR